MQLLSYQSPSYHRASSLDLPALSCFVTTRRVPTRLMRIPAKSRASISARLERSRSTNESVASKFRRGRHPPLPSCWLVLSVSFRRLGFPFSDPIRQDRMQKISSIVMDSIDLFVSKYFASSTKTALPGSSCSSQQKVTCFRVLFNFKADYS
jgi:hypothetical protein